MIIHEESVFKREGERETVISEFEVQTATVAWLCQARRDRWRFSTEDRCHQTASQRMLFQEPKRTPSRTLI